MRWAEGYLLPLRDGRAHPDLIRVRRLIRFMEPYREWPISDLGPDELKAVQGNMVAHRYFSLLPDDMCVFCAAFLVYAA